MSRLKERCRGILQWFSKDRRRYESRIDSLFDLVRTVLPTTRSDSAWLAEVRALALQGSVEWKLKMRGYFRGLAAGHAERPEAIALVEHAVEVCPEAEPVARYVVVPMLWVVTISVAVMSSVVVTWNSLLYWIWFPVAAVTAVAIAQQVPWLRKSMCFRIGRVERIVGIGVYAGSLVLIAFATTFATSQIMQSLSRHSFAQERSRLNQDPQGFPMLRNYARDNYGVEVILGDVQSAWADTELGIPGASVASMSLQSGYCQMNMNRGRVLREFGPPLHGDSVLWSQGVMMHEFAHCLDVRRDLPGFNGRPPSTYAIAPADAGNVIDAQTYVAAGRKGSTMLWREAYADMYAVGFWRLSASPDQAKALTSRLRAKRDEDGGMDRAHATMCWIDQAAQAPLPEGFKDLMSWADRLRGGANCSIRYQARNP